MIYWQQGHSCAVVWGAQQHWDPREQWYQIGFDTKCHHVKGLQALVAGRRPTLRKRAYLVVEKRQHREWRKQQKRKKSLRRKRKGQAADGLQRHMLNVQWTTISSSRHGTNLMDTEGLMKNRRNGWCNGGVIENRKGDLSMTFVCF